ncbi:flavodoxin [Xylocopilactobacillus apis]|uniref:Flavodoxin n=1 Tax=Xylocopilactobacillus apis TaxID=2932183 RepID=A0AAU9DJU7_9LACO|nr:flavodoxin [Xylocopilactobacillus apis]BDR57057.1 flavodoxin [Xylocopilactobacillus apis]
MKRKIALISGLLVLLIGIFSLDFIRSHEHQKVTTSPVVVTKKGQNNKKLGQKGKVLIVFFSRSGTNYPGVTLKIGHTQRIANEIAQVTKGEKFEIRTAKAYPKNYEATVNQAENEQQRNARPKIVGPLPKISKYSTIFLGYPIWWGDIPMPVRSFMDAVDLNHKSVIPFSTNEGSGWGDSLETLKQQYPQADFRGGFEIQGQKADNAQKQIDSWLHSLGY